MKVSYIMAAVLILIGPGQIANSQAFDSITPRELAALLESKKDIFLIDVHIPEQKHLAGTNEFIPYDQIRNNQDKLSFFSIRGNTIKCL